MTGKSAKKHFFFKKVASKNIIKKCAKMTYIISGPPSRIRTSDPWKNDTYYSPLLFQLSYWWLRVPVRLELTTLRSEPSELWDLGKVLFKKNFFFLVEPVCRGQVLVLLTPTRELF